MDRNKKRALFARVVRWAAGWLLVLSATVAQAQNYNFETGTQGWGFTSGGPVTGISQSTDRSYDGTQSLAISLNTSTDAGFVYATSVTAPGGTVFTLHLWVPATYTGPGVEAYVMDANYTWTNGTWINPTPGAWNTLTVTVPNNATSPLAHLGVLTMSTMSAPTTFYLDAVTSVVPDTQAPTAPANFTATASSGTQINLSWTASTDNVGVTGYLVERCAGASCTTYAQIAAPTTASYKDTALSPSTVYRYRVRAKDAANNLSDYSAIGSASSGSDTTIRIDMASETNFTDSLGQVWSADTGYNTGLTAIRTAGIANTVDDALFQTERYDDAAAPELQYAFTVPNGNYQLKLYFSEGYINNTFPNGGVGQRTFDVTAEGVTKLTALDVFAEVGSNVAVIKTFTITVTDGQLNLGFVHGVQNPMVDAIEILSLSADTQAPTVPSSVTATPASATQINLAWTASTDNVGVTNYLIERCQGSGCSSFAQVATSATPSYSNTGLSTSTSYSYRLRATDAAGNLSAYSSLVTATTSAATDTQAPTTPTSFTASAVSSTQLNLSWTASTDNVGVTGYRIERCAGASCTTFAEIATATSTTYSNTGLTAATTYRYRIRATDAAGNLSSYSSIASATTSAAADTQAPTAPTSLGATVISGTQINLSWTASTDNVGVTGYRVERCLGASCTTFAQIATPATTTYSDTTLSSGTSYSYRVRATDAAGNLSSYSNTASGTTTTPPNAPTGLTVTASSKSEIDLTWTAASGGTGVAGYRIERCQGTGCSSFTQIATPTLTTHYDMNLSAATSYSYRVRAIDSGGNLGGYSSVLTVITLSAGTGCD